MIEILYKEWSSKAKAAENAAHQILSVYGDTHSRVISLNDLLKRLSNLPVDINSYFKESIFCLEHELKRASVVMSWAGFFQIFSENVYSKHEADIRKQRTKWVFKDLAELKENYPEAQIIDVAKDVKAINKSEIKIYHGQLAFRNQCAHPTFFQPSLNNAIGFVDNMISQTEKYL